MGEKEGKQKSRRNYGSGGLTQRSDGRWGGSFYADGKRHWEYGRTKAEARQKLETAKARAARGELVAVDKITVERYFTEWLEGKLSYRVNTHSNRDAAIRLHIVPSLGHIQLQKLSLRRIQQWANELTRVKKLASSTVHLYHAVLHTALEDAVKAEILVKNPSTGIDLPPLERKKRTVLDLPQAKQFLGAIETLPWFYPMVVMALTTTMRKGELVALRWSDLDLNKKGLSVQRNAAYRKGKWVEGPPKTKSSERHISLPDFVVEALRKHRLKQIEKQWTAGPDWIENDLVFPNDCGGFRSFGTIDYAMESTLKKAGLPIIPFHSLRHSAASLLLSMGVPPKTVQSILGHSTLEMTMNVYGHLFPSQQLDVATKLDAAFREQLPTDTDGNLAMALAWVRAQVAQHPEEPGGIECLKILENLLFSLEAIS